MELIELQGIYIIIGIIYSFLKCAYDNCYIISIKTILWYLFDIDTYYRSINQDYKIHGAFLSAILSKHLYILLSISFKIVWFQSVCPILVLMLDN